MARLLSHRSMRPVLLAALALLAFGPPAQAAFPGANGKIVFVSGRDAPGSSEVYTMNPDGSGATKLTTDAHTFEPAWSADGTKIAFVGFSGGQTPIYAMNADGSGVTQVTDGGVGDNWPAWSPDGTKIAYASPSQPNAIFDVYTVNVDGTGLTNLTNTPDTEDTLPAWSPDGTKIAFSSDRSGGYAIFVMNSDGSGVTKLTDNPAFTDAPDWSPNGSKIAFVGFNSGSGDIYSMNSDGSGVTQLTSGGFGDNRPAWSPDGAKIAFNRNDDIYTMNPDGSGLTNLTGTTAGDFSPDWQPIPFTGYARPKAASPFNAALVIAYKNCTTPNREHGPPLAYPSCAPPVQESDFLTTGTADSNGQATQFTGSARFRTLVGDPATPADEADVTTVLNIADVRNKADLTDYTGEVEATAMLRITDRFNHVTPGGGSDPATMVDIPFPVRASCAATADPAVGGTCAVSSSIDAVVPGAVKERQRAIWEVGAIQVYDGGADGINSTQPNTLFARQGVFVP